MSDWEEPLIDTTAPILLHSKRTRRLQKRLQRRTEKHAVSDEPRTLLDLPSEILVDIFGYLRPSDVFTALRTSRTLESLITRNEKAIVKDIIATRYSVLTRCFPLPVPFEKVDSAAQPALLSERRQELMSIHKKPYQHIRPPDPKAICTCLTCMLAWNNLCLLIDFARWQDNLDRGEPIPIIPRGRNPEWNQKIVMESSQVVEKAMQSRRWYARILEQHLASTTRAIKRLSTARRKNPPFQMSTEDASSETDWFTERSGPPSYEFPFHRDNYYMLEAYLPNRRWEKEGQRWLYYPESQHEWDMEWIMRQAVLHEEQERARLHKADTPCMAIRTIY